MKTRILFTNYLVPGFSYYCAFFFFFKLKKGSRCNVMTLSTRRMWYALWRKQIFGFTQAWTIVLFTMTPKLMKQQYIFNKMSLNTNTYKTRLCVDHLTKILWAEAGRTLTLFPLSAMSISTNLVFTATLHKYHELQESAVLR